MRSRWTWLFGLCAAATLASTPALAWGEFGHKVSALIAYHRLTPRTKAAVDRLLLQGRDGLTDPDFVSVSTWADRERFTDRASGGWHIADLPVRGTAAPAGCAPGPKRDAACLVEKLNEFAQQLSGPSPDPRSLKFLINLVADVHEPLHVADNGDHGGNCVQLVNPKDEADSNLHTYWDTTIVRQLGSSPEEIAARIEHGMAPGQADSWVRAVQAGGPAASFSAMADETLAVARRDVYGTLPPMRGCAKVVLPASYATNAKAVTEQQLAKSGVRLAAILNRLFDR